MGIIMIRQIDGIINQQNKPNWISLYISLVDCFVKHYNQTFHPTSVCMLTLKHLSPGHLESDLCLNNRGS